jgi:hypothetical protein
MQTTRAHLEYALCIAIRHRRSASCNYCKKKGPAPRRGHGHSFEPAVEGNKLLIAFYFYHMNRTNNPPDLSPMYYQAEEP